MEVLKVSSKSNIWPLGARSRLCWWIFISIDFNEIYIIQEEKLMVGLGWIQHFLPGRQIVTPLKDWTQHI